MIGMTAVSIASVFLVVGSVQTSQQQEFDDALRAVQTAHDAGRYESAIEHLDVALDRVPGYPALIWLRARLHARAGNAGGAIGSLRELATMGVAYDARDHDAFEGIAHAKDFLDVVESMEKLREPLARAAAAFVLEERQFIPEGIAYDAKRDRFFISSVYRREIVAVPRAGGPSAVFADAADKLGSVLGLHVDPKLGLLWAVSADLPQGRDHDPDARAGTALLAFDLTSGERRLHLMPPAGAEGARFNDVALGPDGSVVVSDAAGGAIYRLPPGGTELETLVEPGVLRSPGGLAYSADGGILWIADWSRGLFVLRRAEGEGARPRRVTGPAHGTLFGIDGLVRHGSDLIAIQNGVEPHRVVRLVPDNSGTAIERIELLERARPDYDEPTLGVVVDGALWYIANSHWGGFDDEGKIHPAAKLTPPLVLRLALP